MPLRRGFGQASGATRHGRTLSGIGKLYLIEQRVAPAIAAAAARL
jgi:hypothetical protein